MGAWTRHYRLSSLNSSNRFFCQNYLVLPLALCALELEDQLLGGLGLLPQDGLGLASEALLLAVVPGEQSSVTSRRHKASRSTSHGA